ncbi:hypothetical protein GCM10011344_11350 [Dokdonia pacifica]|uniref:Platelet-activating factor acetylhydrolase, isoform II n=1 Tax=Dokdonia pacifica TaxID=1627892 RepID=A0A238YGT7_9FLAO|nr:hypothetical protein [Dokdonia pacifica]GGG12387.1 hypothetical protein GCM10011344_11350 [Dokdonia pacifica]SNR70347.1 Platelet-activating factor acetylhydrolase, isoform II [Dokdonia pacifica]
MRILEIVLLCIVTILPFVKRPVLKISKKKPLLMILALIVICHLIFEGWRWQMFPVYVLLMIVLWRIYQVNETLSIKLTFIRVLGYVILIIVLFPSWMVPNVLPVFSLPKPTGIYQVGTHAIHLKTDMDEPITKDETDKREIMVKVWYPSNNNAFAKEVPYLDKANRTSFIQKYGGGILPPASMNYLDRVTTHVYQEAPIIEDTFPVVLFSHGYGSNASGYYALLSEIASHGYIVINMNHTYESLATTFPDGSEKFFDYEFQAIDGADAMQHITPIKNAFENDYSYDERHAIIREASKEYNVTKMVKRWTKDMIYTLDQLEDWNKNGFLKNRLDLEKIGVFGHSRGGGAAGQLTIKDTRIKAAVNIDGVQWGEMMDTMYHKPFLYISADWPADHHDINAHTYKHKSTDYFYESKLLTAAHPNFMDIPLMIPVESLAQTGTIDAKLGIQITNELILSFFDKHLKKDKIADPQNVAKKYELLDMTVYKNGNKF